jgi:hypothetical protein
MKETTDQYITRVLGYVEGKNLLDVLADSPKHIARVVTGVSRDRMAKRPQPDKWSVTEILAHLADVELVQGFRMRLILGADGVAIQGFDQDAWAGEDNYAGQDPSFSLEACRIMRERNLRLLKGLSVAQWERHGIHSERGKETVRRVAEMLAGHDINHLRQIEAILGA